jgi:drug/metabolite transporter (DMT)-like permease
VSSSVDHFRVILVWCVACVLWSSTFLFIRVGLQQIPPFTFASLRLAVALTVLAPIVLARGGWQSVTRRDLLHIAVAGLLLLSANYALIFWGAQFIDSGLVAILLSATPLIALMLGWTVGSERVTAVKVAAILAGIIGVAIIFRSDLGTSTRASALAAAAIIGAASCVAGAYVWIKHRTPTARPATVTALQSAVGFVPLAVIALAVEDAPPLTAWSVATWVALLYLAVGASVVAFYLNYWLLARMDTSAMLMMGVVEVPIAVMLGAWFLGERLPADILVGGIVVLAGVMALLRVS